MSIPRSNLLPTSLPISIQRLYQMDINSTEFRTLLVNIVQSLNNILVAVNSKPSGNYDTNEIATGSTLYPDKSLSSYTSKSPVSRQILNKTVVLGTLPNNTTKTVAHGIDLGSGFLMLGIRGAATNAAKDKSISLGYSSPVLAENISIWTDTTNVNIKTGMDRTEFTDAQVILEYIKG